MTISLSREDMVRLAVKRKLKETVQNAFALRLYRPHPKQVEFHATSKRLRAFWAGNRVGKSTSGAVEAVWRALGKHPYHKKPPCDVYVVSPTFEVQRDVSQAMIMKFLPKGNIAKIAWRDKSKGYIERIVVYAGAGKHVHITFKSAEQGREVFQGFSAPAVWIDEECPMDIYTEIVMRTLDCRGSIWITATPIIGDLYQMIVEPEPGQEDPEAWFIHASWADNPHLSEDERHRLFVTMPDEDKEARIYGRWVPRTGRVIPEFREEVHCITAFAAFGEGNLEPPPHWRKVGGFDYGLRAPTAFLCAVTDGEAIYFYDEHYAAEKVPQEHAQAIKARMAKGVRRIKADPSIRNRGPDKKSVQQLYRDLGVSMLLGHSGEGSWERRIELWKQLLHYERDEAGGIKTKPRIFIIQDRCPHLVKELRGLRWKESRSGILHEDTQGPDHAIDSGGYIMEDLAPAILHPERRKQVKPYAYKPRNAVTGY